jgi:hypothetical protein
MVKRQYYIPQHVIGFIAGRPNGTEAPEPRNKIFAIYFYDFGL